MVLALGLVDLGLPVHGMSGNRRGPRCGEWNFVREVSIVWGAGVLQSGECQGQERTMPEGMISGCPLQSEDGHSKAMDQSHHEGPFTGDGFCWVSTA